MPPQLEARLHRGQCAKLRPGCSSPHPCSTDAMNAIPREARTVRKIQLWAVDADQSALQASQVEAVNNTETEEVLEDLLVASPDLLMSNLTLIGRQLPTGGGPLDLIGIDSDGQLVVFELKRGTLTRDAVAQVLDYASDLASLDDDRFARLIEENSGRKGIDPIEDFSDWYSQEHPNEAGFLASPPKMVLVGLGVDERARRIVNFLADAGIDIQLLTFHAFRRDGNLFLARQVETVAPAAARDRIAAPTKEGNRKILHESAEALGVKDLLEEVAAFINDRIPAYCWPGKTAYSFSLQEKTSEGRPTFRSYVTLYLNPKEPGSLTLMMPPRAAALAAEAIDQFCSTVATAVRDKNRYSAIEICFSRADWAVLSDQLEKLLASIVHGWKRASASATEDDSEA